ncbi:MAG TPA: hypothetical protein VNM90_02425 [Haliangium sp.]|nr:hypothetical protein [Haliangium sp.]
MIGILGAHNAWFVAAIAAGMLALFGIPLLVRPLAWARRLGWRIPVETHLAIYFGRCLGAVICVLGLLAFQAARDPELRPFFSNVMLGCFGLMTALHIDGAVRRIQPRAETYEIGLWLLLLALTVLFYPIEAVHSAELPDAMPRH